MGSFTSNKIWEYDGGGNRGDRYMYVTVSQTKGTAIENKSTINWTIYADGASYWADTGPTTLKIGGVEKYYKGRTSWSAGTFPVANGSVSGSFTVDHNDDGTTPNLAVSLSTAINTGSVSTVTGTLTMDTIDRYFSETPTFTLSSKNETSLSFNWRTSETCSKIVCYYKLSTASSWSNVTKYNDSTGATSGNFSLTGLTAGKTYNIYIKAKRKDSGLESDSATAEYTTYNYPYIKSVVNSTLTIGNQQTATIYNPLGHTIAFYMKQTSTSGTTLFSITNLSPGTGENITYNFTPDANTLYNSIPNSQTGNAIYYCIYTDGSSIAHQSSILSGTYQINGTEVPTMPSYMFVFSEGNSTVETIVGRGNFVQSLSIINALVDEMPTTNNGATLANCVVTIGGGNQKTVTGKNQVITWSELNLSGMTNVYVTATDSRGLSNTASWWIMFYPYSYPTISGVAARINNYGENVTITASYTSSPVTINDTDKNGIKVQYSGANKSGYLVGSSSSYGTATSGSQSANLTEISNTNSYVFTFTITDKFGKSATGTAPLPIGQPLMFVDSEQMGVGINKFPTVAGLDVSGPIKGTAADGKNKNVSTLLNYGAQQFIIEGDKDTYYPVLFRVKDNDRVGFPYISCTVSRQFNDPGPDWGYDQDGVHKGGLTLSFLWSGDSAWGGNSKTIKYMDFDETYADMVAQTKLTTDGFAIWLRGGNATYYFHSQIGSCMDINPCLSAYTCANGLIIEPLTTINTEEKLSIRTSICGPALAAYPVGSIYISTVNTDPHNLFGGTWSRITNRFLYATSGTSKATGGSSTRTLSASNIPKHSHSIPALSGSTTTDGAHRHVVTKSTTSYAGGTQDTWRCLSWKDTSHDFSDTIYSNEGSNDGGHSHDVSIPGDTYSTGEYGGNSSGNTASFSLMPPYYTVYAWERIA